MKDYNLINQRATTCKHGGHCEWIACDKCSHYEPDVLNQQPCEDCRNCKEWNRCPCGKEGHENGTSIGYSIGECKNYEPCDDCISRQVVLDMLEDINAETEGVGFYYEHYVEYIKNLPSVAPKEKTGKWIRWYETIEQEHCTIHDPHCKCSECNQEYDPYIASLFNYCPNCGARMVSE